MGRSFKFSVVALWAVLVVAIGGPAQAAVAAVPPPHVLVLSVSASPGSLGPSGGRVQVTGRVRYASSCQLELLSRQSFPVVYSHDATTACSRGTFSATVVIGPNPTAVRRTVAFALVARNQTSYFTGRFYVSLAPLLAPLVLSAQAKPASLGPSGGAVEVAGSVLHARYCQLVLLSHQGFPVVFSHNPTSACRSGAFSATVVIGPNPTAVRRTVAFALVALNGPRSFVGRFFVTLGPQLTPVVVSATAAPAALGPHGGQFEVTGSVRNARSCQLALLSHQGFPVVFSHNASTACRGGTFSASVVVGANTTDVQRTVAFALVAQDGRKTATGYASVTLAPNPNPLPPPAPPPGPANRYPAGATGYDVSWPQCSARGSVTTKALPDQPALAIVGVNDGTISGFNSCFSAEAAWAGPGFSVYIVLQPSPGGGAQYELSGPKASCAATTRLCQAYDWGYNYARADVAFVRALGLSPNIWWLDVETAEGWATSAAAQPANAAVIQGALDAIGATGYTAGVYSTWYQWGEITGSYVPTPALPIWVAGALSLDGGYYGAQSYCQRALSPGDPSTLGSSDIGFAGGTPWLVQYAQTSGPVPVDRDYACG
jgi:hypothetical protein